MSFQLTEAGRPDYSCHVFPGGRLLNARCTIALLIFGAPVFYAQASVASQGAPFVVAGLGKGAVPIDGPWQFHLGDDPLWAQAVFDDSGWESILTDAPWGQQGHPSYTGIAWYRRHVELSHGPATDGKLQILIPSAEDALEVYWDGQLIGRHGKLPPRPSWGYSNVPSSFPLTVTHAGVLAIRVWNAPQDIFSFSESGGLSKTPLIGDPETISLYERELSWSDIQMELFEYSLVLLRAFITILCVILWSRNRQAQLFIWVGLYMALPAVLHILRGRLFFSFSYAVARSINQPLYVLSNVSLWFLLIWLLGHNENHLLVRRTKTLACLALAAGLCDGILAYFWGSATPWMQWADGLLTVFMLLTEVFPLVLIATSLRRRLDVSRWAVALTAFAQQLLLTIADMSALGRRFTHLRLYDTLIDVPVFSIRGIDFQLEKITSLALFASIMFAVYSFILEQGKRRRELEQEMQSAREIQQVLIPETLPLVEGYAISSAYTPAQEVGGDFFQIIALDGYSAGSVLIVLGDVSGKGLRAAMAVSLIVGAVRSVAEITASPSAILAALNRRLEGRLKGGFATAISLRFDPDGSCTVACAGHPPPFLNSTELAMPGALPLGLAPAASYEETSILLRQGDRLVLYTDGLLEARNQSGELFGFDRLKALFATNPTALQATDAAVTFGQDDDITILTLTRLGTGEESTAEHATPTLVPA